MADLSDPVGPGDHARGPAGAVTVVEYGDYECPYSRAAYRRVQRVERRLDGDLRFVFRHFPLAHHPHARQAAEAAEIAAAQGTFWQMHDLLFRRQDALALKELRAYAAAVGLDLDRFDAELRSGAHAARVDADLASGRASGVRGTPTLFLDGDRHRGPSDFAALLAAVEERRANEARRPRRPSPAGE